ncbi:MAG: hypothetical protein ACK5OX_05010 [Desertimonas sp.]
MRVTAVSWSHRRWFLGVPGVVPLLALRGTRHRFRVAVPVSRGVWRRWQRRHLAALCVITFGLAFIASSPFRGNALVGLGILIVVAGAGYRTRAARNYWVTCRLDPDRHTITVEPTHSEFDRAARQLFECSLHR